MKKLLLLILMCGGLFAPLHGQTFNEQKGKLKEQLAKATDDSSKAELALQLGGGYSFSNIDSSLYYLDQALVFINKTGYPKLRAAFLSIKGMTLLQAGKLPESRQLQFEALQIVQKLNFTLGEAVVLNRIGNTYMELADYRKANEYYFLSSELAKQVHRLNYYNELSNIGNIYELLGQPDSALYYQQIVLDTLNKMSKTDRRGLLIRPEIMFKMGNALKLNGDTAQALAFYKKGIEEALYDNDIRNLALNNLFLGKLYRDMGLYDSSLKFTYKALKTGQTASFRKGIYDASLLMAALYKHNNRYDSAYKYLSFANEVRDSLFGPNRIQEMQRIMLSQQEMQQQAEKEQTALKTWYRTLAFSIAILLTLLLALYLWKNIRKQKKVNATLEEQQFKISSQNQELEKTLQELKSTQSQLIQSEKMASLGELTAGIAHEIQNPLNFVNNFSEVNKELLLEMKDEIEKGNLDEVKTIANDVIANEEKINHHGKRADVIVKGMLQHSRTNSGQKELTDINALADEYLRLAYHGLKAKDKTFNANFKTDFDESLPKINIVPQDIGRVLLNIINNAFYAVNEKSKTADENYKPLVTVVSQSPSLRERGWGEVVLTITDNANGIPTNIIDKIFQPFFTTKPTGHGTGLGLSLSYDIVKAHGGELEVETKEREGTTFTIKLPLQS